LKTCLSFFFETKSPSVYYSGILDLTMELKIMNKNDYRENGRRTAPRSKVFVILFWLSIAFIITVILLERFGISWG